MTRKLGERSRRRKGDLAAKIARKYPRLSESDLATYLAHLATIPEPKPVPEVEAGYASWCQRGRQVTIGSEALGRDPRARAAAGLLALFRAFNVRAMVNTSGQGAWDAIVQVDGKKRTLGLCASEWPLHWALELPAERMADQPCDIWVCAHTDGQARWRVDFVGCCRYGQVKDSHVMIPKIASSGQRLVEVAAVPFDKLDSLDDLLIRAATRGEAVVKGAA